MADVRSNWHHHRGEEFTKRKRSESNNENFSTNSQSSFYESALHHSYSKVGSPLSKSPQHEGEEKKEEATSRQQRQQAPPVQQQYSYDDDDDDGIPDLETQPPPGAAGGVDYENGYPPQQQAEPANRAERKARKLMSRLGLKPVQDILKVTLKINMHEYNGYDDGGETYETYAIDNPDVFEKHGRFVVFGPALRVNPNHQQQAAQQRAAMQQAAAQQVVTPSYAPPVEAYKQPAFIEEVEEEPAPVVVQEDEEHEIVFEDSPHAVTEATNVFATATAAFGQQDASDLDEKDINLVMSQAGCSRSKAVAALHDNHGDLVNAIMALTL